MALIPDHIIEQVREAHDVVDIVRRTVELKQAGSGFKGLCPFHDEKTPSFTVSPTRQTFKCFGCGKGGNVFGFLIETAGLNFPEAVRQLAEERGIVIPDDGPQDPELDQRRDRMRAALKFAHTYFARMLNTDVGLEARNYLEKRGYDEQARREFGLGYAPAEWSGLIDAARAKGISEKALDEAGLVRPRKERDGFYDYYRHRVMFPIADARGRLATFAGRAMDPDDPAKYMNGPGTDLFRKSNVLYMLHRASPVIRKRGEALLMEGYTDVLMCHLHGFGNAVAGMGTAFTDGQARQLKRSAERIVLVYDADDAGRAAAEKSAEMLLQEGLEVRVALLPEGRDVDEILLEEGREAFEAVLADAPEFFEFKLSMLGTRHDLDAPRGRAKASEALVASIAKVPSPIERDQLVRMVAERLGGGPDTEAVLRKELSRRLTSRGPGRRGPAARRTPAAPSAPPPGTGPMGTTPMDGHVEEFLDTSPMAPEGAADAPPVPAAPARPADAFSRMTSSLQERDELDLLAAALELPVLRDAIFRAAGPEEFTAPARERLYNALLSIQEQGGEIDPRSVHTQFQADPEVVAVIAGLPELTSPRGATLEERVTSWIATTEQHRLQIHHQRETARLARGEAASVDVAEDLDPDGSWYGDDAATRVADGDAISTNPVRVTLRGGGAHDGAADPEA